MDKITDLSIVQEVWQCDESVIQVHNHDVRSYDKMYYIKPWSRLCDVKKVLPRPQTLSRCEGVALQTNHSPDCTFLPFEKRLRRITAMQIFFSKLAISFTCLINYKHENHPATTLNEMFQYFPPNWIIDAPRKKNYTSQLLLSSKLR